jgi:hypothetical protein
VCAANSSANDARGWLRRATPATSAVRESRTIATTYVGATGPAAQLKRPSIANAQQDGVQQYHLFGICIIILLDPNLILKGHIK